MGNITEYLNKIKTAIYGKEVRGAMYDAIKKVYDDAAQSGNANMEVVLARGTEPNLNARLDKMSEATENNSADLATKANQSEVDIALSTISQGGPKELFYSLSAMLNTYPNGASITVLVYDSAFTDGPHSFIWDGSEWVDLGVYQADGIADGSVTEKSTTFFTVGVNKFDKSNITANQGINYLTGGVFASDIYNTTDYMPVVAEAKFVFTGLASAHFAFYDENKVYIPNSVNAISSPFTAPSGAKYIRMSVTNENIDIAMLIRSSILPDYYIPYRVMNSSYIPELHNKASLSYVDEKIKSSNSTYLVNSINKFDKSNVITGQYIDYLTGTTKANSNYNATDFIPVTQNEDYTFTGLASAHFAFYDENKVYIPNSVNAISSPFTAPSGAKYIRMSVTNENIDIAMFVKGNELPNYYVPYQIFNDILIPSLKNKVDVIEGKGLSTNDFTDADKANLDSLIGGGSVIDCFLPSEVCVAVGRTIEIYNEQVCLQAEKYHLQWVCSVGNALKRKFSITGTLDLIGEYTLTLNIINDKLDVVKSISTTLKIVSNQLSSNLEIVPFGDSLTNGKPWLTTINQLSNGSISLVGTRWNGFGENSGIRHEGRSGAAVSFYLSPTATYSFDNNGVDNKNPLYDSANNRISWNYYKEYYGINPNGIVLFLGTNGIQLDSSTQVNFFDTLISRIRADDSDIPIYIVNTIYRSNQDGIGNQTGNDGYNASPGQFKYEEDKKVFNLMTGLYDKFKDSANIYFIPLALTHDSEYNFGQQEVPVNPHSGVKTIIPKDSIHPQEDGETLTFPGYMQFADTIFSAICAHQGQ